LAYHWEVNIGFWLPLAGSGNPGDTSVNKAYLLMFEFDEQGRLKRFKTISSLWPMSRRKVEEWALAGNKKAF
jgi:hypothetical protein